MAKTKHDWSRADAMTAEEMHAAALADRDAQPLTPSVWRACAGRRRCGSLAARLVYPRRNLQRGEAERLGHCCPITRR